MSENLNSYLSTLQSAARQDFTTLHHHLKEFVSSGHFLSFLLSLKNEKSLLTAAAARSYRHHNGFDKIVLVPGDNITPFELRLHVWWGNRGNKGAENIHDHKWDFSSVVLKGGYDYEIFEVDKTAMNGQRMAEFLFTTREGKRKYSTPFRGQDHLICTSRGSIQRGDSYFLRHNILHRITANGDETTITLLAQGTPVKKGARVFADKPDVLPRRVESLPFTTLELKRKLERITETGQTWL
jgi:hypothetical protein